MRRLRRSVLVAGACVGTAVVLTASACGTGQGGSTPHDEGASSSPSAFEFKPLDAGSRHQHAATQPPHVRASRSTLADCEP